MDDVSGKRRPARPRHQPAVAAAPARLALYGQSLALPVFAATIFLSALLLFSVQPLVAKMVLPVLGGAPATWAVSLCFFQAVLLLGYAYAHALAGARRGVLPLHLLVLIVAFLTLPIGLPAGLDPPPANAYGWLIGVLAGMVGLPFFAMSASAPLLQAWFRRSAHARSADPYFLYAASNAGSLAALLAYPLLIEPLIPLSAQRQWWAGFFALLAAMVALCGLIALARPGAPSPSLAPVESVASPPTSWGRRAEWVFLGFVPSGLLVAFTTYVTTDLASAPLLWVLPLALYLATFIVTFRAAALPGRAALSALQPAAVGGVILAGEWAGSFSWAVAAALGLLAFLITSLLCHGELYRRRPRAAALTAFYLWMSVGGVCGGAFAALAAPFLFKNVLEFPLLLGLGLLARPALHCELAHSRGRLLLALLVAAGVAAALLLGRLIAWEAIANTPATRLWVLGALALLLVGAQRFPRWQCAAASALVAAVALLPFANAPVYSTRSFFGTHRVVAAGSFHLLLHGTTLHGIQHIAEPGTRPVPIGYYYVGSPMHLSVLLARAAAGGPDSPLNVGIVGLGTGALACYALAGDTWRFFEIDPAVARIAGNPRYFRSLAECTPQAAIVLGDARLTLKRQVEGSFDLLIVDAFSSDAIPVHLLTVEALDLYGRLLTERGILALHISNQNLDLPPVLEANLALLPQLHGVYAEGERGPGALASQVVLVAKRAEALDGALTLPKARRLGQGHVRPWTDDYSDIVSAMLRRYASKLAGG
jgi:hypothetical protein